MTECKIVDLSQHRDKMDAEVQQKIIEQLNMLKEAAEDNRLRQVMVQFQVENEEDREELDTYMLFWNTEFNFDQMIGFADRFKQRLIFTAETIEQGEE